MATDSTTKTFMWYIRNKGKNSVLGIIDSDGAVNATAGLNIEYWYTEIPDDITSDNDTLPIPLEYEDALLSGVVYELLKLSGINERSYRREFERGMEDALHAQIKETAQTAIIKPYDLRRD